MGQHHVAAARRQRPPVLGGTDNLARRLALPAGEVIPAIAKGTVYRPGVAGNAEAREGTLQHRAQRMIDRFGGFAERLLHRPGEAKVDNARPLGHQTAAGAAKPYRPAARGKMRADRRQIRKLTIAPGTTNPCGACQSWATASPALALANSGCSAWRDPRKTAAPARRGKRRGQQSARVN